MNENKNNNRKRFNFPHIPHRLVYGLLAGLYFGSCMGFDKTTVTALVALGYALLALGSQG